MLFRSRIDLNKYGAELKEFLLTKGISVEEYYNDSKLVAKIRRAEKQKSKKLDLSKYGISV